MSEQWSLLTPLGRAKKLLPARACEMCGTWFQLNHAQVRGQDPGKYCSKTCAHEGLKAPEKPCIGCGTPIPDKKGRHKNRSAYCSRGCGARYARYEHVAVRPLSVAYAYQRHLKAGRLYRAPVDTRSTSDKYWEDVSRGKVRTCPGCGVEWCALRGTGPGPSCSPECSMVCRKRAARENKRRNRKWTDKNHRQRARHYGVELGPVNRKRVFSRDGMRCQCCGVTCRSDGNWLADDAPELDHVVPLSRGGGHIEDNVQLLCRRCNRMKGDKDDVMFKTIAKFCYANQ